MNRMNLGVGLLMSGLVWMLVGLGLTINDTPNVGVPILAVGGIGMTLGFVLAFAYHDIDAEGAP